MRRLVVFTLSLAVLASAGCGDSGNPIGPPAIGTSTASGPSSSIGGSTNPTPTPTPPTTGGGSSNLICLPNRGTMSALIDGAPWAATCMQAVSFVANTLSIVASNGVHTVTVGAIVTTPGSIDLTTGGAFGSVTILQTASTWTTANNGGSGTLTLSRLDLQGAIGTFSFSAPAATSTPAIGRKVVTNGEFNVTF